jgi:hypothetical protein
MVLHRPIETTVLFGLAPAEFWASAFSTIPRLQKIGILGKAGFLGRSRQRAPKDGLILELLKSLCNKSTRSGGAGLTPSV